MSSPQMNAGYAADDAFKPSQAVLMCLDWDRETVIFEFGTHDHLDEVRDAVSDDFDIILLLVKD